MTDKQLFIQSLQAELEIVNREIDYFEQQLASMPDHKYAGFKTKLETIKQHRNEVLLRYLRVKESGDSTWMQLKESFEANWLVFVESVRKAKTEFQ